jgi:hypothetical protein
MVENLGGRSNFSQNHYFGFYCIFINKFFLKICRGGGGRGPHVIPPCTSPCINVHLYCNHYARYFIVTFSWELRRTRSPFYLLEKWSDKGWKDFEKLSTQIQHRVPSSDCPFWKIMFQVFIKLLRFWIFINKGP